MKIFETARCSVERKLVTAVRPTAQGVHSHSPEPCNSPLTGINCPSRRSIGDATLAGRNRKAHQRPVFIAGAFFVPAMSRYGGGARDTFGCAGLLSSRSANPRAAATPHRFYPLNTQSRPTSKPQKAIQIISRLASEQCGKVMSQREQCPAD